MRRVGCTFLGFVIAIPALAFQVPPPGLTAETRAASVQWLQALQKDNGGFAADPASGPTLPATSSALRAIRYFGGKISHQDTCARFVRSCYDPATGGFGATPGAKPDVRTTAVGLMAAKELNLGTEPFPGAAAYLEQNARDFEEVRIAAAAFEAIGKLPATAAAWRQGLLQKRNPDGTFGQGGGQARETGGALVALVRLGGGTGEDQQAAVKALRAGQRSDGGWGKEGEPSDLETTYRVMRAFHVLKAKPDVAACQGFLAKCRRPDGSYGVQPGLAGNVSATYFAAIVSHWLEEMQAR